MGSELRVVIDDRVDSTAIAERREADRYPIGSPSKADALIRMKHAELAARNAPGGFWVSAADPTVVNHAITGTVPANSVRRSVVLTDGAARIVRMFNAMSWAELIETLDDLGPGEVLSRVRKLEASDPEGLKWPRNKRSDDATVVCMTGRVSY